MAWEKPKTDWVSSDAPDAAAFNRIEKNISELQNSKRNESSIVPVSNGGTGSSTVAAARRNLGLGETSGALPVKNGGTGATSETSARRNLGVEDVSIYMSCSVSSNGGEATNASYGSASSVAFKGIRVGNYIICSAHIDKRASEDRWVRIETGRNVIAVVASVYKSSALRVA